MSKKLVFLTFLLVASVLTFGVSFSFAANNDGNMINNATDGARNMVNDAENAVEGERCRESEGGDAIGGEGDVWCKS